MFVKNSFFEMPKDPKTPYIMVGPGTGVVPFIGFMQERRIMKEQQGKDLGEAYLYFGCRKSDSDYIYKEEMEEQLKDNIVSDLRLAFSREGQK
jgi:NADPH-ferrihemoprotein reductase